MIFYIYVGQSKRRGLIPILPRFFFKAMKNVLFDWVWTLLAFIGHPAANVKEELTMLWGYRIMRAELLQMQILSPEGH